VAHTTGVRHFVAVTAGAVLLLVAGTREAPAQTGFLQAGYGVELRRFSADESDRVFDADTSNLAIGFSGFVTPRFSAGVELEIGADTTVERTTTLTISGRPTTVTTSFTTHRRGVSALAGVHNAPTARVRLGVYGGLAFSSVRREVASDAPPIVLSDPPEPSVFTDRSARPLVGFDAAVRVAEHLAVVASIRAQGLTLTGELGGFSIRPTAALRIMF
jgi:hypothetical protein